MSFFADLKKNVNGFFHPAPVPPRERCRRMPARALVWNKEGVLLDTHCGDGTYSFQNFTGHISRYDGEDCEVRNASIVYHASRMALLAGIRPEIKWYGGPDPDCNFIEWKEGELLSGYLKCSHWENGTVAGGELECSSFESGTVNGGTVHCLSWNGGHFHNGSLFCYEWLCGTFDGGTFRGKWHSGVWNGGTFRGKWYGGVWNGGSFEGKVLTGDGTFAWISGNQRNQQKTRQGI